MIRDLHENLKNGKITSVELTQKYFDEIEKKDKDILAYLTLHKDSALKTAQEVDDKLKRGEEIDLLSGIPMALKDNMCLKGGRTTAASKILDNYISPYDATVVKK